MGMREGLKKIEWVKFLFILLVVSIFLFAPGSLSSILSIVDSILRMDMMSKMVLLLIVLIVLARVYQDRQNNKSG